MERRLVIYPICGLLAVVLAFQACSRQSEFLTGSPPTPVLNVAGNGDGYEGKPDSYEYRDPRSLCREIGADQQALPNKQIFVYRSGKTDLVRRDCADIPPQALTSADFSVDPQGDINYQNQTYARNVTPGDFDVLAADCPTGRSLLPNPVRQNLLLSSQDLQASPWGGMNIQGLTQRLDGSLAGLPLFAIERTDPAALENYRRPAQRPTQQAGETYVFSFFAKTNASERALFISDTAGLQDLEIEFNLTTGAPTILTSQGVSNVSTAARSFSGGLFLSAYFTSTGTGNPHIGVASAGQFLGSSVSLTAFQLERVASFCSP